MTQSWVRSFVQAVERQNTGALMARLDREDPLAASFLAQGEVTADRIYNHGKQEFGKYNSGNSDKWRKVGPNLVTSHLLSVHHWRQNQLLVRSVLCVLLCDVPSAAAYTAVAV